MSLLVFKLKDVCSAAMRVPVVLTFTSRRSLATSNSVLQNKLEISDSAVSRLNQIAGEQGWLRVAVEGGGCSGFQYKLDLEEGGTGLELGEDDVVVEKDGARVVVDQTSLEYLQVD